MKTFAPQNISPDARPLLELEVNGLSLGWTNCDVILEQPSSLCLHELIERNAQLRPSAIAVICGRNALTYEELDRRATRLAVHLLDQGVGPETIVGICVEPSTDAVVGLLGILKAGGAYLPLDPSYPPERLAFMIADSSVQLLLTQDALRGRLPEGQMRTVCLDKPLIKPKRRSRHNRVARAEPHHLAYVIYTSGSTGNPKGVMIDHRSAVNTLVAVNKQFEIESGDRVLALSSLSFDLSVFDVFGLLSVGGTIVIPEPHQVREPAQWVSLITEHSITIWNTVPALMEMLVRQTEGRSEVCFPALRRVLLSGDWISVSLPDRVRKLSPNAQVISLGGATEASIWSIYYPIDEVDPQWKSIPYGIPLANQEVYVLNESLQICTTGEVGELYIGGGGVARGYLNRRELNEQRFITVSSLAGKSERLYKTGDMGRYLSDGNIEFLGRTDSQVKINGYRVELGEIETALTRHPAVREAAVVASPNGTGLWAYVVPVASPSRKTVELQDYLRQFLPEYMVPGLFTVIDAMPLTANGKVDRAALPAPQRVVADHVPLEGETQNKLAAIWQQMLCVPHVGANDHFMRLGGDSLQALQLMLQIEEAFDVHLSMAAVLREAPTLVQLAALIDAHTMSTPAVALKIQKSVGGSETPLSYQQLQLWVLEHLHAKTAAYNIPIAFRLTGVLDTQALRWCLCEIERRHEVLRTRFAGQGQPHQIVETDRDLQFSQADLRGVPREQRESRARKLLVEQTQQPFELAQGSLMRALLVRVDEEEHLLLIVMHHIVCDGWSMGVINLELSALYNAASNGRPSPLPDLTVQYSDFARCQRGYYDAERLAEPLAYWKQKLGGELPVLQLPTDRPRPVERSFRGATRTFHWDRQFVTDLKSLGRRGGATLFMTLLTGFKTLLMRYSGQDDIVVGAPLAGRDRKELQNLIGYFVNVVALRTDLTGEPSFLELLDRVSQTATQAYANQEYPFEKLVRELPGSRQAGNAPLFQTMFQLLNTPLPPVRLEGLTVSSLEVDAATAKFDIVLTMTETDQGLTGSLEYDIDLFDAGRIDRMIGHLRALLTHAVGQPDCAITELNLLTSDERQQLVVAWNDTAREYPRDATIAELFEAQVAQTPSATALACGEQSLNYAELNQRANQLAQRLRDGGVKAGDLVAICAERSIGMVEGLLAILKTGAAYVPLDANQPAARMAHILAETQVSALVVHPHQSQAVPEHSLPTIVLDERAWADEPTTNLASLITADQPAYVMYTSGSTGEPKGVVIPQRGVVRLVKETDYAHWEAGDVFLQLAPLAFDASTFEIWGALLRGATLAIMPPGQYTLTDLAGAIAKHQVTVLWLTSGLFQQMVEGNLAGLRPVKQLLAGGDVLPVASVRKVLRELPHCTLINGYGPTESTTFTCCFSMNSQTQIGESVPIGRPIANTEVYLLDRNLVPVPLGVPGEICIGGDGLAAGYLNQPELTTEKFIPHPFCDQPGARLYRSGDRARYLPDGTLMFLGRTDNQIKIRGYRVELAEIEHALRRHIQIADCVVSAQPVSNGDKQLLAHFVPRGTDQPSASELREFLAVTLPSYMIPRHFVGLDQLPLTANGKLDRAALIAPRHLSENRETTSTPTDECEGTLLELWRKLFGSETLGPDDAFFDIGGDSLMAVGLLAGVQNIFGRSLSIDVLLERPTVRALAALLRDSRPAFRSGVVAIKPTGTRLPLFCVPGIGGSLVEFHNLAAELGNDQPVYGLEPFGLDGVQLPHRSIAHMAAYNIHGMQTVQQHGPYQLAGYSLGGIVAFEMAQQLQARGEQVALLALLDAPLEDPVESLPFWQRTMIHARHLRRRDMLGRWRYIVGRLRSLRVRLQRFLSGQQTEDELVERLELSPASRRLAHSHWPAWKEYVPQVYAGTLTLFSAAEQPDRPRNLPRDKYQGWMGLSSKEIDVHTIPGAHLEIFQKANVRVLARELRGCLPQDSH